MADANMPAGAKRKRLQDAADILPITHTSTASLSLLEPPLPTSYPGHKRP